MTADPDIVLLGNSAFIYGSDNLCVSIIFLTLQISFELLIGGGTVNNYFKLYVGLTQYILELPKKHVIKTINSDFQSLITRLDHPWAIPASTIINS